MATRIGLERKVCPLPTVQLSIELDLIAGLN